VANRKSLLERPGLLEVVHELLERFDAHLKADQFYSVIANMRGATPEEVATVLINAEGLQVGRGQRQSCTLMSCLCSKHLPAAAGSG
jgi:hypothetical protein